MVERWNIGRALDRRMAAQRHDACAGPAEIAEQQLEQRRAADDLRTVGVLRPGDGVRERRGALGSGVIEQRLRNFQKCVARQPVARWTISGV